MASRRVAKPASARSKRGTEMLHKLGAVEAARQIRAGAITSEQLVRACLARIEAREPEVRAWVHLDPSAALKQARALDRHLARGGKPLGPLHGVPVGVKDVLDTFDMPTGMGSPIFDGWQPRSDAACVALVRGAGGVVMGKTVTCELAGIAPRETMNPLDPKRTPGGSSSGSGAAVADFHVPLAFGTQTGGSTIRPASFCGVVGYKPTFNLINRAGMKFAAEGVDTVGVIARDVADAALLTDVCVSRPPRPIEQLRSPPRIGLCRTYLWDAKGSPETKAAVEGAARLAEKAGARVADFALAGEFTRLTEVREIVNNYERAMGLAWEWAHHRGKLSQQMTRTVELGLAVRNADYVDVVRLSERCRAELDRLLEPFDVLLAPAVNGEAPVGLAYAGDPAFQSLWTLLHVPTITVPFATGPNGMPVGIQLIAARHKDHTLLESAQWIAGLR